MSIFLTNQAQFCSKTFYERKIEKSWLPSWILIRCTSQHDFLGLFIPTNKMRCSILCCVEDVVVKINLKVETREKMVSIHNSFTFHQEPLSELLNIEYWILKYFSWNFMYYGMRWIWASFCISFHIFKCTRAKIRW